MLIFNIKENFDVLSEGIFYHDFGINTKGSWNEGVQSKSLLGTNSRHLYTPNSCYDHNLSSLLRLHEHPFASSSSTKIEHRFDNIGISLFRF